MLRLDSWSPSKRGRLLLLLLLSLRLNNLHFWYLLLLLFFLFVSLATLVFLLSWHDSIKFLVLKLDRLPEFSNVTIHKRCLNVLNPHALTIEFVTHFLEPSEGVHHLLILDLLRHGLFLLFFDLSCVYSLTRSIAVRSLAAHEFEIVVLHDLLLSFKPVLEHVKSAEAYTEIMGDLKHSSKVGLGHIRDINVLFGKVMIVGLWIFNDEMVWYLRRVLNSLLSSTTSRS